ncbi:hypothetical protein [Lysinibacillus sp. CTST325]
MEQKKASGYRASACFYLHSANLFFAKAKRQLQKTSTSEGDEMNEDKASGGCHGF